MRFLATAFLFLAMSLRGAAQPAPAEASGQPAVSNSAVRVADPHLDLPGYLAERSAALAIRERNFDPFGRIKDPSKAPPPPEIDPNAVENPSHVPEEPKVDPKVAFEQAVGGLKVVMVGDGEFTIEGGTTLRRGQYFMLAAPEMRFKVQVMRVSPRAIELQETANGHKSIISVNLMPSGMSRGGAARMPGQMASPSSVPEIQSSNATQPTTPGVP
jgi:hypothetical protein